MKVGPPAGRRQFILKIEFLFGETCWIGIVLSKWILIFLSLSYLCFGILLLEIIVALFVILQLLISANHLINK